MFLSLGPERFFISISSQNNPTLLDGMYESNSRIIILIANGHNAALRTTLRRPTKMLFKPT